MYKCMHVKSTKANKETHEWMNEWMRIIHIHNQLKNNIKQREEREKNEEIHNNETEQPMFVHYYY